MLWLSEVNGHKCDNRSLDQVKKMFNFSFKRIYNGF